jgi:hypothetical protein
MKTARLKAALFGVLAIALFTAEAAAYYNPAVGRFLTRDPGPGSAVARPGGSTTLPTGRTIQRAPTGTNQYADGPNLYQYVRSNPALYVDPSGLLSSDNTFDSHGTPLRVKTDYCCPSELAMIETAVRSAYMTLQSTKDATQPLEAAWPDLTVHAIAHQRFLNFFHDGNPYHHTQEDQRRQDVRQLGGVLWKIIDKMDNDGGMHFVCDTGERYKEKDCGGGVSGWSRRGWGAVHLCPDFFNKVGKAGRSQVVIHEFTHRYAWTKDDSEEGGSTYLWDTTYGDNPSSISGVPEYDNGLPDKPFKHADTIAEFTMAWYFESY